MEAAKAGSVELVRTILRKGGNPNALDINRLSAVHFAAMGAFFEVCYLLTKCLFSLFIFSGVRFFCFVFLRFNLSFDHGIVAVFLFKVYTV